jgi:hypothetical protein
MFVSDLLAHRHIVHKHSLFTSWMDPPLNPFGKKIAATIPSHTKIHVYVYNKVFRAKKMHGTHTPSLCSPK